MGAGGTTGGTSAGGPGPGGHSTNDHRNEVIDPLQRVYREIAILKKLDHQYAYIYIYIYGILYMQS